MDEASDSSILENPPWRRSKRKYKMGLSPTSLDSWITVNPKKEILDYKRRSLTQNYEKVVAFTEESTLGQRALEAFTGVAHDSIYPDAIANVASLIAEDICIIDTSDNNRFIAGCVCSPSYWDLNRKIGQTLWHVHQEVDGLNSYLGKKIDHFVRGLSFKRAFKRENWFVHGDTQRMHVHPEEDLRSEPESWFIRTERETICRISEDFIVFTINPRFVSLSALLDYPEAADCLKVVLKGFTEEEITYFGGRRKFDQLARFLEFNDKNS